MHDKICHNITKFCKNITKNITQLEFVIFSQKYDRIYEENIRRVHFLEGGENYFSSKVVKFWGLATHY
jgi:hypothetical protein